MSTKTLKRAIDKILTDAPPANWGAGANMRKMLRERAKGDAIIDRFERGEITKERAQKELLSLGYSQESIKEYLS